MKPIVPFVVALCTAGGVWARWAAPEIAPGAAQSLESDAPEADGTPEPLAEGEPEGAMHLAPAGGGCVAPRPSPDPYDGPAIVGGAPAESSPDDVVGPSAPPMAASLPLDVRLVDAETGRPAASATWDVAHERGGSLPGGAPRGHVRIHDARVTSELQVTAGPSEVAWDAPSWNEAVSRYAERFAATYPLRREVVVSVSVATADGRSTVGELAVSATVAGRSVQAPWLPTGRPSGGPPDSLDLEVRGVPLLRGEALSISVSERRGTAWHTADWADTLGHDLRTRLDVTMTLPERADEDTGFLGRGGRRSLRIGCGCGGRLVRPPRETGVLVLDVVRTDGRPASGAQVRVSSQDDSSLHGFSRSLGARGRARFVGLEDGVWEVELREVGLVPTTGEVRVIAGSVTPFVLREHPGASLHLEVTDDAGRPLPFATFQVAETPSGMDWVDVAGGVQRLDGFTDERGCRALHRLGEGPTRIRVAYGSRRAETTVDVPASGSVPVRMVVR